MNKPIKSPADVEALIKRLGFNRAIFLRACGVKPSTFQSWKKQGEIANNSALMLFNLLNSEPDIMSKLRAVCDAS
jgi:DNA-binding transcriptional regulator YiaG